MPIEEVKAKSKKGKTMKKLLFAATAVAVCVALADVEGDGIVGYVKREVVRNSYNMLAIQFQDPGSIVEAGDITKAITTDLPCLDYCDYGTADMPNILIKTKDTDAECAKSFYYMCDSEYEEIGPDQFEVLPNGWYTAEEEEPTAADFVKPGNSFWVIIPDGCLPDDKQTFTFSMN